MGVDEGLRRLILGLSNSQHPAWDQLQDQYEEADLASVEDLPEQYPHVVSYMHKSAASSDPSAHTLFDPKGRPVDYSVREGREHQARAMDRVTCIVVLNEHRKEQKVKLIEDRGMARQISMRRFHSLKWCFKHTWRFALSFLRFYSRSVAARFLVYESFANRSIVDIVYQDISSANYIWAIVGLLLEHFYPYIFLRSHSDIDQRWMWMTRDPRLEAPLLALEVSHISAAAMCLPWTLAQRLNEMQLLPLWPRMATRTGVVDTRLFLRVAINLATSAFIRCVIPSIHSFVNLYTYTRLREMKASREFPSSDIHPKLSFHWEPLLFTVNYTCNFALNAATRILAPHLAGAHDLTDLKSKKKLVDSLPFSFQELEYRFQVILRQLFAMPIQALECRFLATAVMHLYRAIGFPGTARMLQADLYRPGLRVGVGYGAGGSVGYAGKIGLGLAAEGTSLLVFYVAGLFCGEVDELGHV